MKMITNKTTFFIDLIIITWHKLINNYKINQNKMKCKKIFLDFGTNKLQGLLHFQKKLNINSSWIIEGYEPNKNVYSQAINKIDKKNPLSPFYNYESIAIHNAAVSDTNGYEEIKNITHVVRNGIVEKRDFGGSTLVQNNIWQWDKVTYEKDYVATIDVNDILNKIILEHGKKSKIYIKCDIEGYEYKVIKRMLDSENIKYVKKMFIEWHERFFEDIEKKKEEKSMLIKHLRELKISVFDHH